MHSPALQLLRNNKNYRYYSIGHALSQIGSWMQQAALNWIIASSLVSLSKVSMVYALSYLPVFLFSLLGGYLADSYSKRKILITTQFLHILLSVGYAFFVLTDSLSVLSMFVMSFMAGVLLAIDMPTHQAFLPSLVKKNDYFQATSINLSIFHSSRLIGSAIAGFLMIYMPISLIFIINALSFLVLIIYLMLMSPSNEKVTLKSSEDFNYIEVISYIKRTKLIKVIFGLNFLSSFFVLPFLIVFIAACVNRYTNTYSSAVGFAMSISAIGAFIGSICIAKISENFRGKILILGSMLCSMLLLVCGYSPNYQVFTLTIFGVSFCISLVQGVATAILQNVTENKFKGRIFGINTLIFTAAVPLSSIAFGYISDYYGISAIFILCSIVFFTSTFLWLYNAGFWNYDCLESNSVMQIIGEEYEKS